MELKAAKILRDWGEAWQCVRFIERKRHFTVVFLNGNLSILMAM